MAGSIQSITTRPRIRPARTLSLLALAAIALFANACDRGGHPAHIGALAPEFRVTDGTQSADLAQYRGRIVVLNFWATWCIPCIEELPSLEALQRRMPQLAVVGISDDQDAAAYSRFLRDYRVDFTNIRDPSFHIPTMYGTVKLPETYIIDRQGILRRKFVSAQDWTSTEILDYLNKL